MSHQKKIERVLELLINEEHEAASELLHSVIVEKARDLYEELVDEDFGGDEKDDFADEIEADKEEIESEEIYDGDEDDADDVSDDDVEDADDAEEEEIVDRVEELEANLAELQAEFDTLVADEMEEPEHADIAGALGDEEDFGDVEGELPDEDEFEVEGMYEEDVDDLDEATKLQDEVKGKVLDSEGKLTGTGKQSKVGATGKEAPFTKAPKKKEQGGKPHPTGLGGDESGKKASQGKDNTPEDNIDVPQKKAGDKVRKEDGDDQSAESVLGSKGNPTGA